MPSVRTIEQVRLLRSYILAKTCTIPACGRPPAAGQPYCINHFMTKCARGVAWAERPLLQSARRVYVCAARTHLAELHRRGDITILSAVNELAGYLEGHCYFQTLRPSDLGRRGITGERKCRSILRAIHERFNKNSELAALAILSIGVGTVLACKVEPKVERHAHFSRAAVASALWAAVRLPTVHNSVSSYKPHRPRLAGRKLHEAVEKLVINKYVRWILTEETSKDILKLVISHTYPRLDWWTRARNNWTRNGRDHGGRSEVNRTTDAEGEHMAKQTEDERLVKRRKWARKWREDNKEKLRQYASTYKSKPGIKEKIREHAKQYNAKPETKERLRKWDAKWRDKNKDKPEYKTRKQAKDRTYRATHRDKITKSILDLKRKWLLRCCHATPGELRCQCPGCPVTDIDMLTFGHIHGGGTRERRENGAAGRFILNRLNSGRDTVCNFITQCMACNRLDASLGECPHKDADSETSHMNEVNTKSYAYLESKEICIDHYTQGRWECTECHEAITTWTGTIDHINADGAAHRREIGNINMFQRIVVDFNQTGQWMGGVRVTCFNCNLKGAVVKAGEDAKKRANGMQVPRRVEAHSIVPVCPKRRHGQHGKRRRDIRTGFELYSSKPNLKKKKKKGE